MKLWTKIFFCILLVFIIAFDAGVWALASYSYNYNLERETQLGISEQSVIASSVSSSISRAEQFDSDILAYSQKLKSIIKPLSDYYQLQGVGLALYQDDTELFSNINGVNSELLDFSDKESKNIYETSDGKNHRLFVASPLDGYSRLTLVYCRDISGLDVFRSNIIKYFILLNIIITVSISIIIYLVLRHFTKPISELNNMASEIAGGSYEKRIKIKSNDEVGELSASFNHMASSVEHTMKYLKKSSEDKQQFIDDLAHEMKTPLTAITGYAEFLKNTNTTEENRITALEHLHNSAERLQNLSQELLKLTLLKNDATEMEQIPAKELLGLLEETMKFSLEKRKISLKTCVQTDYIYGNKTLLLSLLSNLVENSARASKENDVILVRAFKNDVSTVIEVKDSGIGISPEDISRITAPFYRVDKSRSRSFGGAGLGMSIVAQIAKVHNAELKITSEINKGTTISVIFTT